MKRPLLITAVLAGSLTLGACSGPSYWFKSSPERWNLRAQDVCEDVREDRHQKRFDRKVEEARADLNLRADQQPAFDRVIAELKAIEGIAEKRCAFEQASPPQNGVEAVVRGSEMFSTAAGQANRIASALTDLHAVLDDNQRATLDEILRWRS